MSDLWVWGLRYSTRKSWVLSTSWCPSEAVCLNRLPCYDRAYLSLGQTPAPLTLMFVFLVSPDINTALAHWHTDTQTDRKSSLMSFSSRLLGEQQGRCFGYKTGHRVCVHGYISYEPERCVCELQCAFPHPHASLPPSLPGPSLIYLSDWFPTLSLLVSVFFDQVVFCYQTRNQTSLWQPFTPQFKVPSLLRQALLCQRAVWQRSAFHAGRALFSQGSSIAVVCQVVGPDCL